MQSSCLLRTPVPIPPGISNHRPYTLGCLPAQWGINPHSARNPSTMAYCFPIGRKKGQQTLSKPISRQGGRIFSTCTSSSLAPLGAKGSPLHLATDPLPQRKHRQPVSFCFGLFGSSVVCVHLPGTLGGSRTAHWRNVLCCEGCFGLQDGRTPRWLGQMQFLTKAGTCP